jgi:hypothetical protein
MSNEIRNIVGNLVTEPQTLKQQRTGQSFFVDETTAPVTNEGNLLSLMTMRDFYKDNNGAVPEAVNNLFKNVALEESRYMMSALAVLADKSKNSQRIQNKFGRDFNAAKEIAKMLKEKADEREFEKTLDPFVSRLASTRLEKRAGMVVGNEQQNIDANKASDDLLDAAFKAISM